MILAIPSSLLAAIPVAIAAGVVSFASPCVLPLVPGYIAFMSGTIGVSHQPRSRLRAVSGALAFIGGLSFVFVTEGAIFGELGVHLQSDLRHWQVAFGILTILLGLFFAGWLPNAWLQRDVRWHQIPAATIIGAALLGFIFALGWTPCIGPMLAVVNGLALSSSNATALHGSILALAYCVGIGIPFLLFAVAGDFAVRSSSWLRRHQQAIAIIGGVMLIAIGVAEIAGWWQSWVLWIKIHSPVNSLPL